MRRAHPKAGWPERIRVSRESMWALLMPLIIVVGIRFGLFTDNEAAAVVVVYALVIGFWVYRDPRLVHLGEVFYSAGRTAAIVLFLLGAAGTR